MCVSRRLFCSSTCGHLLWMMLRSASEDRPFRFKVFAFINVMEHRAGFTDCIPLLAPSQEMEESQTQCCPRRRRPRCMSCRQDIPPDYELACAEPSCPLRVLCFPCTEWCLTCKRDFCQWHFMRHSNCDQRM